MGRRSERSHRGPDWIDIRMKRRPESHDSRLVRLRELTCLYSRFFGRHAWKSHEISPFRSLREVLAYQKEMATRKPSSPSKPEEDTSR